MSRLNSAQGPQVIHRLLHASKLFSGMPQDVRDDLSSHFAALSFRAGDVVVQRGDAGRTLGVLLEGQVAVMARKDEQTFRLATLEAGALFGEMSFFDARGARTADIVGVTDGVAALLDAESYEQLAQDGAMAAELLERNVLANLAERIGTTNATLAELLTQTDSGLLAALGRFFRGSP